MCSSLMIFVFSFKGLRLLSIIYSLSSGLSSCSAVSKVEELEEARGAETLFQEATSTINLAFNKGQTDTKAPIIWPQGVSLFS